MSSPLRVLYLENDPADTELLQDTLEMDGVGCNLTRVETEPDFLAALQKGGFDLILANYSLPTFDGLSALRIARQQRPDLPFIFLSGTLGEEVAIEALKIGATDYILKSGLSRLVPSVKRALREAGERSERKRAEELLQQQANLLSLTHDAIFVRDMNGVIRYWNLAAEELYGWPTEQAIGKLAHELLKTIFPVPFDQVEEELMRTGRWQGEVVHTKQNGTTMVVASRWSLQRDENGRPIEILATNNDITERKRAEQARQEMEEQWRAAFESNPTMYFIVDAAGAIVSVNAFGAAQLGYTVSELVGLPVLNVFYGADREAVQKHAEECFEQPGRMMTWEARKIRKDGTMVWVRETGNAVLLEKRPVLLVVCEDITEQKHAEEAARQSESELRNLTENVPAMGFIALPGPVNAFVTRPWLDYTGLSAEETAGSGWQSVIHPEDLERHLEKWRVCSATGEPYEDETRFRRAADGEYRWFLVRAAALRDENGRILKWYGSLTDIADRKRAEGLLTGAKRILEMVAKGDPLAQILDSLCRLVEEQASGVLASVLLVDGDRLRHGGAPSLPKAYTDAIDGVVIGPSVGSCGTAAYRGEPVIVADIANDPLWADYREAALPHSLRACWSTPVFSSRARVIATFAMYYCEPCSPSARDQDIIEQITHLAGVAIERRLTGEALRRSEAYLSEAQKLTHTGSWAYNPVIQKMTYWSEEMFRICGLDLQGHVPDREESLQFVHPEDRGRVYEFTTNAFQEKADFDEEYRHVLADGTVKHLHVIGHPVLDETRQLVEYVGTAADVTQRKLAEEELRLLNQELEKRVLERTSQLAEANSRLAKQNEELVLASRMKTEFLARMSHEFRTPLNSIIGFTDLLTERGEGPLEDAYAGYVTHVSEGAHHLLALVNDILDLSRIEAGRIDLRHEEFAAAEAISEVSCVTASLAEAKKIEFRSELSPTLMAYADRTRFKQILYNLLSNAVKFTPVAGRVQVSAEPDYGEIRFCVSDTGIGIPPEQQTAIFEEFTQVAASSGVKEGAGLGLTITKRIIELHGGRIWVDSTPGEGSRFFFTMPTSATGEHRLSITASG